MDISVLFSAMPGAVAQGLIWGIMAIGVYITYKILDVADLTVDGSMCTGGAVSIMMMLNGYNVWVSLLAAFIAGMLAGLVTGIFHTFMGIPAIPRRYFDTAGTVLDQLKDHGTCQSGDQCNEL